MVPIDMLALVIDPTILLSHWSHQTIPLKTLAVFVSAGFLDINFRTSVLFKFRPALCMSGLRIRTRHLSGFSSHILFTPCI